MVTRTDVDAGATENFIYDGGNVALVLDGNGQVLERELYGPAVDQILATEDVTALGAGETQSAGTVNWALPDNEETVRQVAIYDVGTNTTSVLDHIVYDPFGQVAWQSSPSNQPAFTYGGMWQDPVTGLDFNAGSGTWYDAVDAVFAGGGPSSAGGGGGPRTNSYPPVSNGPGNPPGPAGFNLPGRRNSSLPGVFPNPDWNVAGVGTLRRSGGRERRRNARARPPPTAPALPYYTGPVRVASPPPLSGKRPRTHRAPGGPIAHESSHFFQAIDSATNVTPTGPACRLIPRSLCLGNRLSSEFGIDSPYRHDDDPDGVTMAEGLAAAVEGA